MSNVVKISDRFRCNQFNDNDKNMSEERWVRNNVNDMSLNNMFCDDVSHCFSEHTCSAGWSGHDEGTRSMAEH